MINNKTSIAWKFCVQLNETYCLSLRLFLNNLGGNLNISRSYFHIVKY